MGKLKIFFTLVILNCTLLIGEANAQWWVNGGNLLWPFGDVTIQKDLNVYGTIINEGVRPYKVYTALLSQGGDATAPTVIVSENTIGAGTTWVRESVGLYYVTVPIGTYADGKIFNKVWVQLDGGDAYVQISCFLSPADRIYVQFLNPVTLSSIDNFLVHLPVEIRVYP